MTPYVFTVPLVPPSLNDYTRRHWAKRKQVREAFQEQVWASINSAGNRCPRGLARIELHAVIWFAEQRARDADNYGATLWKFTQDVLVRGKVIPDDTADICLGYPPRLMVGSTEMTLITIEEVAA